MGKEGGRKSPSKGSKKTPPKEEYCNEYLGSAPQAAKKTGKKKAKKKEEAEAPQKEKFPTSEIVYNKIRWHPDVDQDSVEVGYLDRFKGLRWAAFAKWNQGGKDDFDSIPWHRVMMFRWKGTVFWNREQRVERLRELFDGVLKPTVGNEEEEDDDEEAGTDLKVRHGVTSRVFPRTDLIDLRVWCDDVQRWMKMAVEGAPENLPLDRPLRVLTWNVLNTRFQSELMRAECRWPNLLREAHEADPDVMCFQEVDLAFAKFLSSDDWIRTNFLISEFMGMPEGPEVMVLIRKDPRFVHPVSVRMHHFTPHVRAVVLVAVVCRKEVCIANLHLTSNRATDAIVKRAQQIEGIFSLAAKHSNCMLVGDWNFGDGPENRAIDWGRFVDAWLVVNGDSSGEEAATFDPKTNPLAAVNTITGRRERYDRLMIRGRCIDPVAARLLGKDESRWYRDETEELDEDSDDTEDGEGEGEECGGVAELHEDPIPRGDTDICRGDGDDGDDGEGILRPIRGVQLQLVLRGLQGIGKTTLCKALGGVLEGVQHVNQDELSRGRKPQEARKAYLKRLGSFSCSRLARILIADRVHAHPQNLTDTVDALVAGARRGSIKPHRVLVRMTAGAQDEVVLCNARATTRSGHPTLPGGVAEPVILSTSHAMQKAVTCPLGMFDDTITIDASGRPSEVLRELLEKLARLECMEGSVPPEDLLKRIDQEVGAASLTASQNGIMSFPSLPPSDHYGVLFELGLVEGEDVEDEPAEGVEAYRGALVQNTALAVVVPPELCDDIQAVRRDLDKAFERWPPHINVLWPFVPPKVWHTYRGEVEAALGRCGISRIPVTLKGLRSWNDFTRGRANLFFDAGEEGNEALREIHRSLRRLFPVEETAKHDYNPHCTVGRCAPGDVSKIAEQYGFTDDGKSVSFTADRLVVLHRTSDSDPMLPIDEILLSHSTDDDLKEKLGMWYRVYKALGEVRDPIKEDLCTPRAVMEKNPLDERKVLQVYSPLDQLEKWALMVLQTTAKVMGKDETVKYCVTSPTHISQLGAQYHIPDCLIDPFLHYWKSSLNAPYPFYLEEIRSNISRVYIDIDVKLCGVESFNIDASGWLEKIWEFTADFFGVAGDMLYGVVTECHGPWEDTLGTTHKSGFRIFFLKLYTPAEVYSRYIKELCRHFVEAVGDYPARPTGYAMEEVIDTNSSSWMRGRLMGTIKRRKDLKRIYHLKAVLAAGKGRGLHLCGKQTEQLHNNTEELLYATTLRLWDAVPSFCRSAPPHVPAAFKGAWFAICGERVVDLASASHRVVSAADYARMGLTRHNTVVITVSSTSAPTPDFPQAAWEQICEELGVDAKLDGPLHEAVCASLPGKVDPETAFRRMLSLTPIRLPPEP